MPRARVSAGRVIGFALATSALLLAMIAPGSALAAKPGIALSAVVSGDDATITIIVNRKASATRSCTYSLDSAPAISCGPKTAVGSKSTRYTVNLMDLTTGEHMISVMVTLTDGGVGSASTSFTILPPPLPYLVVVNPPSAAAGSYRAAGAEFGPAPTSVSGSLVLVIAAGPAPTQGCGPLVGFPAGGIAIIDRGGCSDVDKVLNAQAAGAVAAIIVNDVPGDPTTITGSGPSVTIPSVMVSQASGATIRAGLPATGQVTTAP